MRYFDSIPQDRLMTELRRYVADGRIQSLVEQYLEQEVWDGLAKWRPEAGTPQGAVLSPLLANLYLHPVDAALTETGCLVVRYADDLVILSRSLVVW